MARQHRGTFGCLLRTPLTMTPPSPLEGLSILITGATGSFGRQAVRTLLDRHAPRRLVVFSRDELKQAEMATEWSGPAMRYFIGDVRDRDRLATAMQGVDLVIHAAALKRVDAAEYNPMECIKTNIGGTENVIQAALANGVAKVVVLSTDKATNPVNLYGATKLAADKLTVAANNFAGQNPTRLSVVRYGNVAGSRGSVVPLFRRLAAEGTRDFPITDLRMTRFWLTQADAVDFVLTATTRMQGGEIFVPKLPSVRICDVATAIAPGLPHRVIGRRPGEKLHEVLCPAEDSPLTLEFARHFVIKPSIRFNSRTNDFDTDALGDSGTPVVDGFAYDSGTNARFLSVDDIRAIIT